MNGVTQTSTDYWPNVLYDAREGHIRDGLADDVMRLGGLMHYVELDVNNLSRWLPGPDRRRTAPTRKNDNGFIIYFSDRRNNNDYRRERRDRRVRLRRRRQPGDAAGTPIAEMAQRRRQCRADAGEDLNGNGTLQLYGRARRRTFRRPVLLAAASLIAARAARLHATASVLTNTNLGAGTSAREALVARANQAILFRRALKIVNGGIQTAATRIRAR